MEWEINSKASKYNLSAFEVLNELMRGMMIEQKPDHEILAETFVKYMQMHEQLHQISPQHLTLMAFTLGYYYHVFLKSNEVKVMEESNEDNVSKTSSQPNSTNGTSNSSN